MTWFFEQFVLVPHVPDYRAFDPAFSFLFNSYYEAVGPRHPRPSRGLLTRPPAHEVTRYRRHVDASLAAAIPRLGPEIGAIIELGLHHEQQHQELLVTDMLHAFAAHPLCPPMTPDWRESVGHRGETTFIECPAGLQSVGYRGDRASVSTTRPRVIRSIFEPYAIASRLVRNSEWLEFIEDDGYQTPSLWMSDGWATAQEAGWTAPLHWRDVDGAWFQAGPGGLAPLIPDAPVRHISWYEADAFARWSDARLPTEFEWEVASAQSIRASKRPAMSGSGPKAPTGPIRAIVRRPGAIGEYNGKFMINQMVLRGGSLATPAGHTRPTYRNFFHPDKRWQFSGLRLAKDL